MNPIFSPKSKLGDLVGAGVGAVVLSATDGDGVNVGAYSASVIFVLVDAKLVKVYAMISVRRSYWQQNQFVVNVGFCVGFNTMSCWVLPPM